MSEIEHVCLFAATTCLDCGEVSLVDLHDEAAAATT